VKSESLQLKDTNSMNNLRRIDRHVSRQKINNNYSEHSADGM